MKKSVLLSFCFFLVFSVVMPAQDYHKLTFLVSPGLTIPLGSSTELVGTGGEARLGVGFVPKTLPFLSFNTEAGFTLLPIKPLDSVSMTNFGAGAGVTFFHDKRFNLEVEAAGGMFYGFINDDENAGTGNFYVRGGAGGTFKATPWLDVVLRGDYAYTHLFSHLVSASVGARFSVSLGKPLPRRPESIQLQPLDGSLEIVGLEFFDVFPVLFKYYDNHPVGSVTIENSTPYQVRNLKLSLFVDKYMSDPKICSTGEQLQPGETVTLDLYALFDDSVLGITEGTKVSSRLMLEYTLEDEKRSEENVQTMELFDRNALTWDDDRKAAAFITAKDPQVLEYAKNISSWTGSGHRINKNLGLTVAIHETLGEQGVGYNIDPSSSFSDLSRDNAAIDFIQFPRQTLSYNAGDCDDLSILYCALLESLGVNTSFITVPGHIFIAIDLDLPPVDAAKIFPDTGELIFLDGITWLPLEITKVGDSFMEAWRVGAKQWREHQTDGKSVLLPTAASWKLYRPVGLPGRADKISLPAKEAVVGRYSAEYSGLVSYLIDGKIHALQRQMDNSNSDTKYRNRLGVLYARYGLTEEARDIFQSILVQNDYVPSLINMGIVEFLSPDPAEALEYFSKAGEIEPDNPKAVLYMARAQHKMERYGEARENYAKLTRLDPGLAEQFSYLGGADSAVVRAAAVEDTEGAIVWDEE